MCPAVVGLALSWFAAAGETQRIVEFSIPPAGADRALDLFAQQAEIPLIYPFDVARTVQVKGLSGRYSVEEGIRLLLGDTCLSAEVGAGSRSPHAHNDNEGTTIVKDNCSRNLGRKSLAAAILAALGAGEGYAQEAPKRVIEEVTVSARRQTENLQITPVAVSAITETMLKAKQVNSIESTQYSTPNLNISTSSPNSAGFAFLSMRGQSNLGGTASNDPAIGVYVDGVYIARPGGALLDLIDTRQVEVLRGPQGTLFGRNTTGGALNIISNPAEHALKGSLEVTAGNYDLRQITGMINVPLIEDQLAARLVYRDSQRDGYGENVFRGGADLNDDDRSFYRFSLAYQPTDAKWDLALTADRTDMENSGQLLILTGFNPAGAAAGFALAQPPAGDSLNDYVHPHAGGWYKGYSNEDEWSELTSQGVSATLNIDFGAVQLKSISAWRSLESSGLNDLDGTPYRLLVSGYDNDQSQVSQELQLSGTSGALSWIGGVFYFKEEGDEVTQSANMFGAAAGYPISRNDGTATNTSYAVYGQVYYDLTEKLRLSAGLRYTLDDREVVLRNLTNEALGTCAATSLGDDGVTCRRDLDVDYDYTSYLFGLDYKLTDDIFLYAKTSRAYLAGGWNLRDGSVPSFQPEEVRDIEVGAKMDWLDSRLRTNVALFYAKQSDVQRTATGFISGNSGATTSYILNAADATVQGAEFELVAVPWEGMEIGVTLGLLDAEYDEFVDALGVDRSGEDLPQAPEYNYSVSLTQIIPASYGEWSLHADYAYTDDFVMWQGSTSNPAAEALFARARQLSTSEGHGLVNARVGLTLGRNLELALWGRNLADEEYFSRTQADFLTSFGYAGAYPGNPRTYGASVTYRFGD